MQKTPRFFRKNLPDMHKITKRKSPKLWFVSIENPGKIQYNLVGYFLCFSSRKFLTGWYCTVISALTKFRRVYNFRDPDARGRVCLLIYTVVEYFLVYITSGIFYTQFLQSYDVDITGVGILNFVPFLASMFVFFTPGLLNHFPKRRWLLAVCKFLYYLLNVAGLTLLPALIKDYNTLLYAMIAVSFLSSLFNIVATSGYAAWHIRFQPEEVRAYHMTMSQFLNAMISGILMLTAGWLCDNLGDWFVLALRYFAFGLGIVNIIFLLLPREVEYPVVRSPRFLDIVTIPLKHKKFMRTMLVVFLWQFSMYCYSSQLNYYLLDTIGMTQTFYNIIIFLYGPFFMLFMNFWRKRIERTSWFKVFGIALLVVAPLQILYGFVQPGDFTVKLGTLAMTIPLYVPLVLLVRVPQHFAGTGHNVAFANFQYINMPLTNRDCFTSFYQIIFNLGSLSGMLFGIIFTELTKNFSFTAFGYTYTTGTPLLTMICGVVEFIIVAYVLIGRKRLEPDADAEHA